MSCPKCLQRSIIATCSRPDSLTRTGSVQRAFSTSNTVNAATATDAGYSQQDLDAIAQSSSRYFEKKENSNRGMRPKITFPRPPSNVKWSAEGHMLSTHKSYVQRGQERTPTVRRDIGRGKGLVKPSYSKHNGGEIDPVKISMTVKDELMRKNFNAALNYARSNSSKAPVVGSWNQLIQYKMKQGNASGAFKIYNEMKKRAILPDARTFTVLLSGLAENANYPTALTKALSLYHIMGTSSNVKPSIYHTNAALKVCARAKDMDALWSIAEKIPSSGHLTADSHTYTTIFNALRNSPDLGREKTTADAKHLWDGIMAKWLEGNVVVDENLACSYGRILLLSPSPEDWDEILTLTQQIYGIPRLVPKLGTKARKYMPIPDPGPRKGLDFEDHASTSSAKRAMRSTLTSRSFDAADEQALTRLIKEGNETSDVKAIEEEDVNPFDLPNPGTEGATTARDKALSANVTSGSGILAKPGNNALSLLQQACLSIRTYNAGNEYWSILTENYDVKPDLDNYLWRLRILAQKRDTAESLSTLTDIPRSELVNASNAFFIAMSACRRDADHNKRNTNSLSDASKILDLMDVYEIPVTPKILIAYLHVAQNVKDVNSLRAAWQRIGPEHYDIKTLTNPFPLLASQQDTKNRKASDTKLNVLLDMKLTLLKELIKFADKLESHKEIVWSEGDRKMFKDQSRKYQSYLSKYFNHDGIKTGEPSFMKKITVHRRERKEADKTETAKKPSWRELARSNQAEEDKLTKAPKSHRGPFDHE